MISKEYQKTLRNIHKKTPFGKRAKIPSHLKKFIAACQPKSILDFGCGKGKLVETLNESYPMLDITGYDPANPEFHKVPDQIDMIIGTDVLEHIEPKYLDEVLNFLYNKAKYNYHLISCAPAKLILPDGRNAHLIQETPDWWRKKFLEKGFKILNEDYREFEKFSKQLRKNIPVKNYFMMLEKNE